LSYTPLTATRNAAFPGPGGRRLRVRTRSATPLECSNGCWGSRT